jgi:hypothetical protein
MISLSEREFISYLEEASDALLDLVAKEGLRALKRCLDSSGFADSPYLKDYEIYSELSDGEVSFVIELDETALTDESRRKMRKETGSTFKKNARDVEGRGEAKEFRRVYMMDPKGRPERISGSRDARKPRKDARRFTKDARTKAVDRDKVRHTRNAGERYVDHEFKATAPRSMEVEEDGKLRISMQREIRNTNKKVIFPKGMYQGIIDNFLEELASMMSEQFAKELNVIIARVYK